MFHKRANYSPVLKLTHFTHQSCFISLSLLSTHNSSGAGEQSLQLATHNRATADQPADFQLGLQQLPQAASCAIAFGTLHSLPLAKPVPESHPELLLPGLLPELPPPTTPAELAVLLWSWSKEAPTPDRCRLVLLL